MKRMNETFHNGSISMEYYGDNTLPHYLLHGRTFNQNSELLKMLLHYEGACVEDPQEYARGSCDFDCLNCERSIYHIISTKERMFQLQCRELCERMPRLQDEWEVSLIEHDTPLKYETFFFSCGKAVDDCSIINLTIEALKRFKPDALKSARYCYMKVRRFDMTDAFDVSTAASGQLRAALA